MVTWRRFLREFWWLAGVTRLGWVLDAVMFPGSRSWHAIRDARHSPLDRSTI